MVGWHAMDTGESWMDGPFEWTPVNVGSRDSRDHQQQQQQLQLQQQQQSQQQQQHQHQHQHQQKARSPSLLGFSRVSSQLPVGRAMSRYSQSPVGRSMSQSGDSFLLTAELVIEESQGVLLVNLGVTGTLYVTNFRLIFLVGRGKQLVQLGTIPLLIIESFSKQVSNDIRTGKIFDVQKVSPGSAVSPSTKLLTIVGKDLRTITFGFIPNTKQRKNVLVALGNRSRRTRLWDLYAFINNTLTGGDPRERLRAEYSRMIFGSASASLSNREELRRSNTWRLSEVNANYNVCPTYPSLLVMPASISDEDVQQAAIFRSKGRLPHLCWQNPDNRAVLARSSQPFTGFAMNSRSNADEKLVAALCGPASQRRKLYIADARPRKNALANVAIGGGSESSANYLQCEVIFLGIENIHGMRDSLSRLRQFLDTHGASSSDGSSSILRGGERAWVGGNLTSMSSAVSGLGYSGWLLHCHKILTSAVWIASRIALEGASVLVHCSDGWDRTTQLISLASLMLDPYYRTFQGFQALIEKDWLAFGHMFADRLGTPTYSGVITMAASESGSRQIGPSSTSPGRLSLDSSNSSADSRSPGALSDHYSPIFLQFMDAVAQLLRIYPLAFEFTSAYLVELLDCVMSCRFGNFLCNSEKERVQVGVAESTACMWAYLTQLRKQNGKEHAHYNLFYDRATYSGALLPPAAALAPSLWPQYFLRWSCPSLASTGNCAPTGWTHGGDLEVASHEFAESFFSVQKAKERAEEKMQELMVENKLLLDQLREEQQGRASALAIAERGRRETAALKQVIEAVGCKIRISNLSKQNVDTSDEERSDHEDEQGDNRGQTSSTAARSCQDDGGEESQLAVSVSMRSDMDGNTGAFRRPCGADYNSSCRLRPGESCRWPQTGCARIGSAFIGLRADFVALERLSILDQYFDVERLDTAEEPADTNEPSAQVSGVT